MFLEGALEVGRKFRVLDGAPAFQDSTFLEYSRSSPGARILSDAAAGLRTSEDDFLNNGAEPDGDVSPGALLMPDWLGPLLAISICNWVEYFL